MDPELTTLINQVLQGADGALVFVLLYAIREVRSWTKSVDKAMKHIEELTQSIDQIRNMVAENTEDITKLRKMFFLLKARIDAKAKSE